jgi:3-phytase
MKHRIESNRGAAEFAETDAEKKRNLSDFLRVCLRVLCVSAFVFFSTACEKTIRFATYNASLSREHAGWLLLDLTNPNDPQAKAMADLIQHQNPDVLLLTDVDHDTADRARYMFEQNYLNIPQGGLPEVSYAYNFTGPVNTGIASGYDLDHDGKVITQPGTVQYANDAIGFGFFPGQHGMVLLSRFPIDVEHIRTFTRFKWKNMPGAQLPTDADGKPWYTDEELNLLRLATTNFWDVPITIDKKVVHLLINRPTSTDTDDAAHRNAKRSHDEIRFWDDYLNDNGNEFSVARYISDDTGQHGGFQVEQGKDFIIMGQQNAQAIEPLLKNSKVDAQVSVGHPEIIFSKGFTCTGGSVLTPAPATQPVAGSTSNQRFVFVNVKR